MSLCYFGERFYGPVRFRCSTIPFVVYTDVGSFINITGFLPSVFRSFELQLLFWYLLSSCTFAEFSKFPGSFCRSPFVFPPLLPFSHSFLLCIRRSYCGCFLYLGFFMFALFLPFLVMCWHKTDLIHSSASRFASFPFLIGLHSSSSS